MLWRAGFAKALILAAALHATDTLALEVMEIRSDRTPIVLTDAVELRKTDGNEIELQSAAMPDGRAPMMTARTRAGSHYWAAFALANNGEEQVDRLVVVPHERLVGSGLNATDQPYAGIVDMTANIGEHPGRQSVATADMFRITLDPGTVVTFVAALRTAELPRMYLWDVDAHRHAIIRLGIQDGLAAGAAAAVALLLTIYGLIRGSDLLLAAAFCGWVVFALIAAESDICPDLLDLTVVADRRLRTVVEMLMCLGFLTFLPIYLCSGRQRLASFGLLAGALIVSGILATAIWSGWLAIAAVVRISLAIVAVGGLALLGYGALSGAARAGSLIPTWILLAIWTNMAGLVAAGTVRDHVVAAALLVSLVLIAIAVALTALTRFDDSERFGNA